MTDALPPLSNRETMERTLRALPAFAAWPGTDMTRLIASSRLLWHERGDSLIAKAQDRVPEIIVVMKGHIVQVEESRGSPRTSLAIRGPGHILAFSSLPGIEGRMLDFVANDDAMAVHIPRQLLVDLLDQNPVLWKDMGRALLQLERRQADLVSGQIMGTFAQRLASTVELLVTHYGVRDEKGAPACLRLTQQDLATILHVSRHTVNKQLSGWAASGIIRLKYNAIVVLDLPRLKNIASSLATQEDEEAA